MKPKNPLVAFFQTIRGISFILPLFVLMFALTFIHFFSEDASEVQTSQLDLALCGLQDSTTISIIAGVVGAWIAILSLDRLQRGRANLSLPDLDVERTKFHQDFILGIGTWSIVAISATPFISALLSRRKCSTLPTTTLLILFLIEALTLIVALFLRTPWWEDNPYSRMNFLLAARRLTLTSQLWQASENMDIASACPQTPHAGPMSSSEISGKSPRKPQATSLSAMRKSIWMSVLKTYRPSIIFGAIYCLASLGLIILHYGKLKQTTLLDIWLFALFACVLKLIAIMCHNPLSSFLGTTAEEGIWTILDWSLMAIGLAVAPILCGTLTFALTPTTLSSFQTIAFSLMAQFPVVYIACPPRRRTKALLVQQRNLEAQKAIRDLQLYAEILRFESISPVELISLDLSNFTLKPVTDPKTEAKKPLRELQCFVDVRSTSANMPTISPIKHVLSFAHYLDPGITDLESLLYPPKSAKTLTQD